MEKSYQIHCSQCGSERRVKIISDQTIDWLEDGSPQKIISGRKRLDGEWGFQCFCGNNDILTDQERRAIKNPAQPQPEELTGIIKNLKVQTPKFELVEV